MRTLALIAICALTACGGGGGSGGNDPVAASAPNHGLGWSFTAGAESGLRVRALDSHSMTLAQVADMAAQVRACIAGYYPNQELVVPATLVVFVDAMPADATEDQGVTYFDSMTVAVLAGDHDQRVLAPIVLAHELVHIITYASGMMDQSQEATHQSELFAECGTYQGVHRPAGWSTEQ